jgi:DNA-binding transcriptional regulator YdaS (Cro superfamily)
MDHQSPLARAISLVGLKPLAIVLGVSYQAVQKYEYIGISAERVIAISMATNWQVTPHELRPDIYPHPQDGLPDHMRQAA